MDNLVSIIVPVYNAEKFLAETIESVLNQTYQLYELILVDDGSKDASLAICNKYAAIDSRISIISQNNQGVSAARNIGIEKASGDYICFIDADDCYESSFLETLLNELKNNNSDIVFCNYKYLYGTKQLAKAPRIKNGIYTFAELSGIAIDDGTLSGILFGSVWGAMYSSNLIRKNNVFFDKVIKRNEDGLFNLCLLPLTNKISVIDYSGYLYRQWKKSSNKTIEIDNETEKATLKICDCCFNYADITKQLSCRKVSVVFWNCMSLAKRQLNLFTICKAIRKYLAKNSINNELKYLDYQNISQVKKILIILLKKKCTLSFVIALKYAYPVFGKLMKR